jgi:hypothetical protein
MTLTLQQHATLAGRLWPDNEHATFAVLDGAGIPDLLERLYATPSLEFACLYEGDIEAAVAEVAPYLVRVQPGTELADWLLAGWGQCRGMFALAPAAIEMSALRRHFRKLTMVYGADMQALLFRFYDPRVLRLQLPECGAARLKDFFGPVQRFVIENGASWGVSMSVSHGELVQEIFSVGSDSGRRPVPLRSVS